MQDNPFQNTDVSGIYDNVDHPEVLSYCKEEKQQLLDAISWYKKRKFSNPVINIFGETGSGKTFLLYSLTREFHGQRKGFFVDISPFDVIEERNIDRLAEYIWQEIDIFFTRSILTQNIEYKPIDFFVYKIYDKIIRQAEKKEYAICYKPGIILKKKVPVYANFSKFMEDFKTHKHREKILECVFSQEKDNEVLSWLKNIFLQRKIKPESSCKAIGKLSDFCLSLELPLILVCDQFENLDKSTYTKPIGIFFTQLLELVRAVKKQNCSTVPLFINLLNTQSRETLAHHINTRIPTLPNGKDRVDIDNTLNKDKALEVTKTYLRQKNQHVEKFYPFTREEIEKHYDLYKKLKPINLRTWLIHCCHLWNVRFHNAKPYWKISSLEQESLSDNDEKIKDTTENNVERVSKKDDGHHAELEEQVDKTSTILDDRQSTEDKSMSKSLEKTKIQVHSLEDVSSRLLNPSFVKLLIQYQELNEKQNEKLLALLYVFMSSLKDELHFMNMSSFEKEKNYFCFNKGSKKIYVFFTAKSNQGNGFLSSWKYFKTFLKENEDQNQNYFIKCIRSKNQAIPKSRKFSILRRKETHYYTFDLESRDCDWLKHIYGAIYLLDHEEQLEKHGLPKIEYSEIIWKKVNSNNIEENILRHFRENFLKGIL